MKTSKPSETNRPGRLACEKTFVLHVKKGFEERGRHIENMLGSLGINFEYILDGDMDDITQETISKYFTGKFMGGKFPHTSCALKHIITYEKIIKLGIGGALILEDDIYLHSNFVSIFNRSMEELGGRMAARKCPAIISYEDTRLRFIPRSRREKGRVLYNGDRDRMTGAYYINREAAEMIVCYAMTKKLDHPIDITHCTLLRAGILSYLWCQPTIATQGSANGRHKSGISTNAGLAYPMKWRMKLWYKKLLYLLR